MRSNKPFKACVMLIGLVVVSFLASSLRLNETHIHLDPLELADHELYHNDHDADHQADRTHGKFGLLEDLVDDLPCDHDASDQKHHHCGHSHSPILPLFLESSAGDALGPSFDFVLSIPPADMLSSGFVSTTFRPPRAA